MKIERKYIDLAIIAATLGVILWQRDRIRYFLNLPIKYLTDMKNTDFISQLHPKYKAIFARFISDVEKMGYEFIITSGYRSFEKQAQLKAQNPSNATPGLSTHNYGIAIDGVLYKDNRYWRKATSKKEWEATGVPKLARDVYKMRWGGDFTNYHDPIHFDMNLNTSALLAKYNSLGGKVEGNQIPI